MEGRERRKGWGKKGSWTRMKKQRNVGELTDMHHVTGYKCPQVNKYLQEN